MNWLIRRFVKQPEDTQLPQVRYAYGRLAGFTGQSCHHRGCIQ